MHRKDFLKLALLAGGQLALGQAKALAIQFTSMKDSNDDVKYYFPKDSEYNNLAIGFNLRIQKRPAVIAVCLTTAGVSQAVKKAIENKWPIAIKSGGHCMEGFSSNDGGMVINMSLMNKIVWDNSKTAAVDPGCTLSRLYDNLLPKGRIIPGGSCAGVALGGLTSGGGYGLMSRRFGLTCDSLKSLTMVDGKGNIVQADRELMWGCRGGGAGNFGIITNMVFETHTAPKAMQSIRFVTNKTTASQAKEIFKIWFEKSAALPKECFSACLLNRKTVYILLTNTGAAVSKVQFFIDALKTVSGKTTIGKYIPLPQALKTYYGRPKPLHFKNASSGLYKTFENIEPVLIDVFKKVMDTPGLIYQINTVGGAVADVEKAAQSSFAHRDYPYFSELQAYWEPPQKGISQMAEFENIQQLLLQAGNTAQYRNYPDVNFKNAQEQYYGSSLERLKRLKQQYDPNNIVRHEQSI